MTEPVLRPLALALPLEVFDTDTEDPNIELKSLGKPDAVPKLVLTTPFVLNDSVCTDGGSVVNEVVKDATGASALPDILSILQTYDLSHVRWMIREEKLLREEP